MYLFSLSYLPFGDDDDFAVLFKRHNLSNTVWVARMIDVACGASSHCSINHQIVGQSEHVHTMILKNITYKTVTITTLTQYAV